MKTLTEKAFKEIYLQHFDKAYSIAYRILEDTDEAESIVQDLFTEIWHRRDKISSVLNIESYIMGSANRGAHYARRRKRYLGEQAMATHRNRISIGTMEQVYAEEVRALFHKSLLALRPAWRRMFVLSNCHDICTEELVKRTGYGVSSIHNMLCAARLVVREFFENETYLPKSVRYRGVNYLYATIIKSTDHDKAIKK